MGQKLNAWILTAWHWDFKKESWRPIRLEFQTEEDVEEFLTHTNLEIQRYQVEHKAN